MNAAEPVRFCRHKPGLAKIEVWSPRWHDRRVLVNPLKVKDYNVVAFTKSRSLPGLYYISGKQVRKYPKQSNGTIDCYAVKLDDFVPFEWQEHCEHSY